MHLGSLIGLVAAIFNFDFRCGYAEIAARFNVELLRANSFALMENPEAAAVPDLIAGAFLAFWSEPLALPNKVMASVAIRIVRIVAFTFLPPALLRREFSPLPAPLRQLSCLTFPHAAWPANMPAAFAETARQTLLPARPADGPLQSFAQRRCNSCSGASSNTVIAPAFSSASRLAAWANVPPPSATTRSFRRTARLAAVAVRAALSTARNPGSPSSAKISATRFLFSRFDHAIQIAEIPTQFAGQRLADACLSGAHESNQKHAPV